MSAQMLSSATDIMADANPQLNDMKALEAKAVAASAAGGSDVVKQNISFVRGETQSKAVEESQAQQVCNLTNVILMITRYLEFSFFLCIFEGSIL